MSTLTAEIIDDFFEGEMCDKKRSGYFDFGNNSPCPCKKCSGVGLQKVADAQPTGRIVEVADENNKWRFAPGVKAINHFWSVDGVECLWCARQRSVPEIQVWFDAGKPDEACVPLPLWSVILSAKGR